LRENLNEYYILANQHNKLTRTKNYNSVSNKFIPEFLDTLVEKIPLMAAERSRKLAMADYIYVLTLFYSQKNRIMQDDDKLKHFEQQYGKLLDSMVKITNPVTGSPEGIKIVLELIDDLITNIERGLDSMISGPTKKAPAKANTMQPPTNRFTDSTRTYKIKYAFDDLEEVFDSNVPDNLGVDYIKTNENFYVSPGLTGVSRDDLENRALREINKYNRGSNISVEASVGGLSSMEADLFTTAAASLKKYFPIDMYPLAYTYLTPENVSMHDGMRALSEEINSDLTFYNDIFTNLVRYHERLNMEKDPFTISHINTEEDLGYLSKKSQKFRNNLLDLFSSFGCLVEDMSSFVVPEAKEEKLKVPGEVLDFVAQEGEVETLVSELELIAEQNSPAKDKTAPQDMLFRLLREKMQSAGTNPNTYRLLNDSGQWRSQGAPFNISNSAFTFLPPQLKILMTYFTQLHLVKDKVGINGSVKTNDISKIILPKPENEANIVPNVNSYGGVYLNFLDMMEMQYLEGYKKSEQKSPLEEERVFMKSPIFQKMHYFPFDKISQGPDAVPYNTVSLCRLKRYVHEKFHKNVKIPDFPIYNEYFFISRNPSRKDDGMLAMPTTGEPTLQGVFLSEIAPFSAKQVEDSSVQQNVESVVNTVESMASVISDLQSQMDAQAVQAQLAMEQKGLKKTINDIISGELNTSLSSFPMAEAAIKSGKSKFSPATNAAMSAVKNNLDVNLVGTPAQANRNKKLIRDFVNDITKGTVKSSINTTVLDKTKEALLPAGDVAAQSYKNMLKGISFGKEAPKKAEPEEEEDKD